MKIQIVVSLTDYSPPEIMVGVQLIPWLQYCVLKIQWRILSQMDHQLSIYPPVFLLIYTYRIYKGNRIE